MVVQPGRSATTGKAYPQRVAPLQPRVHRLAVQPWWVKQSGAFRFKSAGWLRLPCSFSPRLQARSHSDFGDRVRPQAQLRSQDEIVRGLGLPPPVGRPHLARFLSSLPPIRLWHPTSIPMRGQQPRLPESMRNLDNARSIKRGQQCVAQYCDSRPTGRGSAYRREQFALERCRQVNQPEARLMSCPNEIGQNSDSMP